jgi:MFS family permease
LLTQRGGLKQVTIGAMLLSAAAIILFGRTGPDLMQLSLVCAVAGFCTNGAIVGLYAIYAQAFPTQVRATGTGFAIGTGRGGAVLGPIAAGYLFTWGYALPTVAVYMAVGSLLAAAVLAFLRLRTDPNQPAAITLFSNARS